MAKVDLSEASEDEIREQLDKVRKERREFSHTGRAKGKRKRSATSKVDKEKVSENWKERMEKKGIEVEEI